MKEEEIHYATLLLLTQNEPLRTKAQAPKKHRISFAAFSFSL